MRSGALRLTAAAFLLAAVGAFMVSAARGELTGGLFLVFPFVTGSGPFAFFALFALIAGSVLLVLAEWRHAADETLDRDRAAPYAEQARTKASHGGVILVGPLPIVWGSDKRVTLWMALAGLALVVALVALMLGRR